MVLELLNLVQAVGTVIVVIGSFVVAYIAAADTAAADAAGWQIGNFGIFIGFAYFGSGCVFGRSWGFTIIWTKLV